VARRAGAGRRQHFVASQAMLVIGIVLREVAEAIDVESGEEADAS
jgi:hypothetical protein